MKENSFRMYSVVPVDAAYFKLYVYSQMKYQYTS